MNEFKIVFFGSPCIGTKNNLIRSILSQPFKDNPYPTIGANMNKLYVNSNLGKINLQLWVTAGQEKYRKLISHFCKDSNCFILGYDITSRDSFDDIKNDFYDIILKYVNNDELIYLVGNKIDLYQFRKVSKEEVKVNAKENNMNFFEVSENRREC